MNKRIKELERQCWIERQFGPPWFDYTKFTELIITESIAVMKANDYHAEWLGEKVKEHFGVDK